MLLFILNLLYHSKVIRTLHKHVLNQILSGLFTYFKISQDLVVLEQQF